MDYYTTLGISKNASEAEIKSAYRKMAMKHHPDRGGDEQTFKKINEAYETLSDPEKKQMVDMGIDPKSQGGRYGNSFNQGAGPFEFHFGGVPPGMEDIFGHFGFGGRQMRRNKSLNVNVEITLEEVLKGKVLDAEIGIPGGQKKLISIEVPPGIEHGQQIKYRGMGDNSIKEATPGDLIVNIFIKEHPVFQRQGDMLLCMKTVSVWDAILGTSLVIETLDKKSLTISVPAGTQPDTMLSCRNEGLPNMRTKHRGNLLVKVLVEIPKNLKVHEKELIENVKSRFI
jgi:curved DNA-binding protein